MPIPSGWSADQVMFYVKEMRDADARFEAERDRRYAEVNIEKEKALKIKETADLTALGLARDIQTYKDERDNRLREQINEERGQFVTRNELQAAVEKIEALVDPVAAYVTGQQGGVSGRKDLVGFVFGAASFVAAVVAIIVVIAR